MRNEGKYSATFTKELVYVYEIEAIKYEWVALPFKQKGEKQTQILLSIQLLTPK